jgi:fumarylacetoacetate (FAA) hydrolase
MKLASKRDGRDGALIVVSKDTKTAVDATHIAKTMQAALDDWDTASVALEALYADLNQGIAQGAYDLDFNAVCAPLPRAYQYLDGACYVSHIRRNRAARGDKLPADILDAPLIYQGISHGFMAWNESIKSPSDDLGIDFEAEIAAVTGDVPLGVSSAEATKHIKLFMLLNDISLRTLIPPELKRSFGFLTGKPCSSLGPIAVTPDELGDLWDGKLVSGKMNCWVRGNKFGELESGIDTPFDYGDMISHVAQTRAFEPGTIIALGTVSNEDETVGFGCIGEQWAVEIINDDTAKTELLKFGDVVKIDHQDYEGKSIFGAIEQKVAPIG